MSASRSTENSARAASAPITRARTGFTMTPGVQRDRRAPAGSPSGCRWAEPPEAHSRSESVVLLPCPAPPLISKLSDRAAIRGRPRPSDASPSLARGRNPWPSSATWITSSSSPRLGGHLQGPGGVLIRVQDDVVAGLGHHGLQVGDALGPEAERLGDSRDRLANDDHVLRRSGKGQLEGAAVHFAGSPDARGFGEGLLPPGVHGQLGPQAGHLEHPIHGVGAIGVDDRKADARHRPPAGVRRGPRRGWTNR